MVSVQTHTRRFVVALPDSWRDAWMAITEIRDGEFLRHENIDLLHLRANLRAFLHELLRLRFHAALNGFSLGDAQFGGVVADVFGDFHGARMRASCAVGHHESAFALFIQRGVEELNPEAGGMTNFEVRWNSIVI